MQVILLSPLAPVFITFSNLVPGRKPIQKSINAFNLQAYRDREKMLHFKRIYPANFFFLMW